MPAPTSPTKGEPPDSAEPSEQVIVQFVPPESNGKADTAWASRRTIRIFGTPRTCPRKESAGEGQVRDEDVDTPRYAERGGIGQFPVRVGAAAMRSATRERRAEQLTCTLVRWALYHAKRIACSAARMASWPAQEPTPRKSCPAGRREVEAR
jgi:hypothetical protein